MTRIDTGIDGLNRFVYAGSVNKTAKNIVPHLKRDLLSEMESVLYNNNTPPACFVLMSRRTLLYQLLFLPTLVLQRRKFYGKLLVTLVAYENETLARLVTRLVE